MSADNGIYWAKFNDGYRVIHAQAIDNLDYFPEGSQKYKNEWKSYFGNAKVFQTEEEALMEARRIEIDMGWTEYGICYLGEYNYSFT